MAVKPSIVIHVFITNYSLSGKCTLAYTLGFMRIWVIGPKNNDWRIQKAGNCKSDLVLLLNQTRANDGFFHSTTQVNGSFYNCSL